MLLRRKCLAVLALGLGVFLFVNLNEVRGDNESLKERCEERCEELEAKDEAAAREKQRKEQQEEKREKEAQEAKVAERRKEKEKEEEERKKKEEREEREAKREREKKEQQDALRKAERQGGAVKRSRGSDGSDDKHESDEDSAKAKRKAEKEDRKRKEDLEEAEDKERELRKKRKEAEDAAEDTVKAAKKKLDRTMELEHEVGDLEKKARGGDSDASDKLKKTQKELRSSRSDAKDLQKTASKRVDDAQEAAHRHEDAMNEVKKLGGSVRYAAGMSAAGQAQKALSDQAEQEHELRMRREGERQKEQMIQEEERRKQASGQYPLDLKNIYVSHGKLKPDFRQDRFSYELELEHPHDQLAITPEIFKDRPEYEGGEHNRPRIEITYKGAPTNVIPEVASVAVRRQIDLPNDEDDLDVQIRVINPYQSSKSVTYHIEVKQPQGTLTVLKGLEASDENGSTVLIEPIPSQDAISYTAFVAPGTQTLMVKADCLGSWMTIDGSSAEKNKPFAVVRDLNRHVQIVEVACGVGGRYWKDQQSNRYFLKVMSDFAKSDIPVPRMVIDNVGRECVAKSSKIVCPDPRGEGGKTRVIGFVEPQIRYTLESSNKDVQVRLLDQTPSVPFTYRNDLKLRAEAGRSNQEWPVHFDLPIGGGWMRFIGWLLSFLLALLLASLCIVLGLTSVLGIGLPFGVTEVASTLTLLLQYFCFSNALRGHGLLDNMTESLKWVTLFWPLPWEARDHDFGDAKDVHNAYGCLYWAFGTLLTAILIHVGVMLKFICCERDFTFPHRLNFGGLESRVVHWLMFPAVTASCMILASAGMPTAWMVLAGLMLSALAIWTIVSWVLVKKAVSDRDAVWVWNTSLREDGAVEDESGYWSDAHCDQLNTEPANRSLCSFFQWKWSSTVADIDPVQISPETFNRRSDYGDDDATSYSSARQSLRHERTYGGNQPYPMAKHPKTVEVYRTRAPGVCCPGQRLIVGLLRTQWLDTIMTYHGLTRFHSQVVRDGGDIFVPLVVKTNQLQGPVTGGRFSFFFDGVRLPFVKICDSLARIALGICIGVALASENYKVDAAMFGLAGTLTTACLIYFAITCPYSRKSENWLYGAVMVAISLSAWSFMGYAISEQQPSTISDIFLWMTAIVAIALACYSCVVTFSLFSAIFCPPLEETRFIERLSNCSVSIADHSEGWAVDMPGYTKYPVRDLKAQCNATSGTGKAVHVSMYTTGEEPTYEFSVEDMKIACRSGALRPPVLCLFAASSGDHLGYAHINVYEKDRVQRAVIEFLSGDPLTRESADEVAKAVGRQMDIRREKAVLSVTVIPPRISAPLNSKYSSDSSDNAYDWSTTSGSGSSRQSSAVTASSSTSSSRTSKSYSTSGSASTYTSASGSGTVSSSRSRGSKRRDRENSSIEMSQSSGRR